MSTRKSIIYIVGSGRSGSTIVDRTIGHHSRAFSLGEIINLRDDYYRNGLCGCGQPIPDCDFWDSILQELCFEAGKEQKEFMANFHQRIENGENKMRKTSRRFMNVLGLLLHIQPRIFSNTSIYDNSIKIFEKVFDSTNASIIIDSSKSITRALFLSRLLPNYNHFFIHLIRDGRGVLYSNFKRHYNLTIRSEKGVLINKKLKSNTRRVPEEVIESWVRANLQVEWIIKLYGLKKQSLRIRLKDFLKGPSQHLAQILKRFDMSYEPSMLSFRYGDNHMVCGNPSRLNAMSLKQEDRNWEETLNPGLLKIFNASEGKRLNEKYGYR